MSSLKEEVIQDLVRILEERISGMIITNKTDVNWLRNLEFRKGISYVEQDLNVSSGRRLRAFASLFIVNVKDSKLLTRGLDGKAVYLPDIEEYTFEEFMYSVQEGSQPKLYSLLANLPYSSPVSKGGDFELHLAYQDLAYEICEDVNEACEYFDNPDLYYPGVDEGIEPVSQEFIDRVIPSLQRELDRELRRDYKNNSDFLRPAVPLAKLPPHIQRALVERRRFRFSQFGIGRKQWDRQYLSIWEIPEDKEYVPRRWLRMC